MPQRNAFKTDSSFFRMLAIGAVGARAVQTALNSMGHKIVELERGALSTRIWKDVKRKRVRIPDLCCTACGVRIECRAKTRTELSMSHSPNDAERAWHYGMLDTDWIAFPILEADEEPWSDGQLADQRSLWRERVRVSWKLVGHVNVFRVRDFKAVSAKQKKPKGVTEGSEVQVSWKAKFAPAPGTVTMTTAGRLDYKPDGGGSPRHFRLEPGERSFVQRGAAFARNQVIAGQIEPLTPKELRCPGGCGEQEIARMLSSRERTVRFTGCKLARFGHHTGLAPRIKELAADTEEDPYVQMEGRVFLCDVAGDSADQHFRPILLDPADEQMRLEAAVALAETRTESAFALLREVLEDAEQPLYLRSACAWAIGCHGTNRAAECLVRLFDDAAPEIREEALVALAGVGVVAVDPLLKGLSRSPNVAAGSAEALRRSRQVRIQDIVALAESTASTWPTWTLAHLPKESVAPHIAALQARRPDIHFAVSVLWAFLESWIAEHWTPRATP